MLSHHTDLLKLNYTFKRIIYIYSDMASSLPSFCPIIAPSRKCRTHQSLQIRAHTFRDEGRSSNMVDANLRILRERMEDVRIKERLERCCRSEIGWNYASPAYNLKHKRVANLAKYFKLIGFIGGTAGLTILSNTLLLCLVSLIVHLNR